MAKIRFETTRRMRVGDDGKRHRIVLRNGVEGYEVTTTAICSGCTDYEMGAIITGPNGCSECGYTGKTRRRHWEPFNIGEWQHAEEQRAIDLVRTRAFYRHQGIGRIVQVVSIRRKAGDVVVAFHGGGITKKNLRDFALAYERVTRAEVESIAARIDEIGEEAACTP